MGTTTHKTNTPWRRKGDFMNNDSWATGWAPQNDEIAVDWNDMFQAYPEVSIHNSCNEFISKVEIPEWTKMDKDYHPVNAEKFGLNGDYPLMVTYSPNTTLGIGYKRVFIVEKASQKPFGKMKEMWKELRKRSQEKAKTKGIYSSPPSISSISTAYANVVFPKGYGIPDNITILENGELRGAFGVPETSAIYGIVYELVSMYNDWRKFPNETEFGSIERLKEAMNNVGRMQMSSSQLEEEINESRSIIKEQQDRISDLEGKLNKLYEDGADAMNLLEEHGVKIDLNGNIKWDAYEGDTISDMIPLISNLTDQYLTIPSEIGSGLTISNDPPDIFCTSSGY